MPLLLLKRFCSYVSRKYFYKLGIKTTVHSFTILFTSLFLICFISYPVLLNNTNIYSLPIIDGHLWQYSPHLHSSNQQQSSFIIQQIRVMSISKEALNTTLSIYQDISISNQYKLICATSSQHQCISHSILSLWDYNQQNIQNDPNILSTINSHLHKKSPRTGISVYPYSTLGHVKMIDNQLDSADSFILTFILKNTENTLAIWNNLLNHVKHQTLSVEPCKLQFKLKLLPNITKSSYIHILIFCFMSILLVILFKNQFSRSRLIKSRTGLGLASIFLSLSCFTMTTRLFQWIQRDMQINPWFLQLFICITTTVEHIFFITTAVIEREKKEISIKEKVGKGLEQTAIPMFVTLILKAVVLVVGSRTNQQNIKNFCLFGLVAISISFLLSLTVFTAILSIDIKRAELSDLNNDDFHVSRPNKKESLAYPQLDKNLNKKRNARRAVNTLIVCIIILYLNIVSPNTTTTTPSTTASPPTANLNEWQTISDQFWDIMNPFYDTQTFDIYPPTIITTANDIDPLQSYYQHQFNLLNQSLSDRTLQYNFLDILHPYFIFTPHHISNVILLIILMLIILWMIPTTRETIMLPTFRHTFVLVATFLLRTISKLTFIKTDTLIRKVESDYDKDGMHAGALSLQSQFNHLQNLERIGHIDIKTFLGQHLSDIRALDGRSDQLVSIDQEGKIVIWNTVTQMPVVCLHRQGQARCVQMNEDVIVAGFDDARLCVWDRHTFQIKSEQQCTSRITHVLLRDESIMSVHRNGDICEWRNGVHVRRILTVPSHIVHVFMDKQYLFTSSKDGQVACWELDTWQQRYVIRNTALITSLATERLRDSFGILVTGADDGAVKVWQLDTGAPLCTLSKGGIIKKEESEVGGPLLQFSTVARHYQPKTEQVDANHGDAIKQVVTTRISNPNFDNDACPGCHTVLSSGFFIASCAMDGSVHVWRLDHVGVYTGCVQCLKDYHPRKHKSEEEWQPLFLGKLEASCLLLFDNMVLAGIRQTQETWEVWFTSLQYYEPVDDWMIPSIACDLEEKQEDEERQEQEDETGVFEYLLYYMFGMKKVSKPVKNKVKQTRIEDDDDMFELLPFSNVRHILPISKTSFCCDYGNFLKLVTFNQEEE